METEWYLSRLLGLQEPEGTESTLGLHYYGERGLASEVQIDYERENYFGSLLGFVINDNGEDRLGRDGSRKDIRKVYELGMHLGVWVNRYFNVNLAGYDLADQGRPDQFGFTAGDGDYPGLGRRFILEARLSLL